MNPRIIINDESHSLLSSSATRPNGISPPPPATANGLSQPSRSPSNTANNNNNCQPQRQSSNASCQLVTVVGGNNNTTVGVSGGSTSITSAMRNSQSSSYSAKLNRSRAIRVSFLLVAAYIICWLPYNALSLIQFIDPELFHKHANKVYCLHGMIVFNSVINPYLYGLFGGLCRGGGGGAGVGRRGDG